MVAAKVKHGIMPRCTYCTKPVLDERGMRVHHAACIERKVALSAAYKRRRDEDDVDADDSADEASSKNSKQLESIRREVVALRASLDEVKVALCLLVPRAGAAAAISVRSAG